jgi:hypothetical protein
MIEKMQYLSSSICLISFNMLISSSIYFPTNDINSFFCMVEKYSVNILCHIFFTHSSVVGCLDRVHNLAIVNNATITCMCRCLHYTLTFIPLGIYPGVVQQDHTGVVFSVSWGTPRLISILDAIIYSATNSV